MAMASFTMSLTSSGIVLSPRVLVLDEILVRPVEVRREQPSGWEGLRGRTGCADVPGRGSNGHRVHRQLRRLLQHARRVHLLHLVLPSHRVLHTPEVRHQTIPFALRQLPFPAALEAIAMFHQYSRAAEAMLRRSFCSASSRFASGCSTVSS